MAVKPNINTTSLQNLRNFPRRTRRSKPDLELHIRTYSSHEKMIALNSSCEIQCIFFLCRQALLTPARYFRVYLSRQHSNHQKEVELANILQLDDLPTKNSFVHDLHLIGYRPRLMTTTWPSQSVSFYGNQHLWKPAI